jgi:hypothetical protein
MLDLIPYFWRQEKNPRKKGNKISNLENGKYQIIIIIVIIIILVEK